MPGHTHTRRPARRFNHPAVAYASVLAVLGTVLTFAGVGISVAESTDAYRPYAWVPRLLAAASVVLIAAALFRILRRLLFTRRRHGG